MAKPSQFSFRRILLLRLLLVSVPVLLLGMCITFVFTYKKGRSALLETARQNLTESAVRKGESISQLIAALKTNIVIASESKILAQGNLAEAESFLDQLSQQLPTDISCIQLLAPDTQTVAVSTCGNRPLYSFDTTLWQSQPSLADSRNRDSIRLQTLVPQTDPTLGIAIDAFQPNTSTLKLLAGAPVYNAQGELRYILTVRSTLRQQENLQPRSLTGESVIIAADGTILMHPEADRVGRNIRNEESAERWQSLMRNASAGRQDFLHLFLDNNVELLAGYTAIPDPSQSQSDPEAKWVVVAVTPLNNALSGLSEIQKTLLTLLLLLTISLVIACVLATIYVARDLARPLEKLGNYALNVDHLNSEEQLPQNFKIREFNQLAIALNSMVNRLKTWASELGSAWEEAQTANRLKSEFLTTISHELRTPLNGIIGSLRLIEDGFCDDREEELEFLQQADEAAVHLLGIIDDILDISKIEAGQYAVNPEQVNLQKILHEVISLQSLAIRDKGLDLNVLDWHEDIIVYADPAKLKQVLINIIDNATKFTKTGSITIKSFVEIAEIHPQFPADNNRQNKPVLTNKQVILRVQDTGIGVAAEDMDKLFRPFVMVDGSTTRESGGTGLGLAIARNFMNLMGGSITLTSLGKNQGTTVELRLPVVKTGALAMMEAQAVDLPPLAASELPDSGSGTSGTIKQSS
jgi:two-component system sensor histidine kinase BarA